MLLWKHPGSLILASRAGLNIQHLTLRFVFELKYSGSERNIAVLISMPIYPSALIPGINVAVANLLDWDVSKHFWRYFYSLHTTVVLRT